MDYNTEWREGDYSIEVRIGDMKSVSWKMKWHVQFINAILVTALTSYGSFPHVRDCEGIPNTVDR